MNNETPIQKAARIAGGQSALARAVGVSPQAVQKWCDTGEVPGKRVLMVERHTGVSRTELSPEMYPQESREVA